MSAAAVALANRARYLWKPVPPLRRDNAARFLAICSAECGSSSGVDRLVARVSSCVENHRNPFAHARPPMTSRKLCF